MQEDKEAVFDAVDTLKLCLTPLIPMVETMTVKEDKMRAAGGRGLYQRHGLRRLPGGGEGPALPGRLQNHRGAGGPVHPEGPDPGDPAPGGVPGCMPRL